VGFSQGLFTYTGIGIGIGMDVSGRSLLGRSDYNSRRNWNDEGRMAGVPTKLADQGNFRVAGIARWSCPPRHSRP
jgi:hypothetical protein